MATVGVLLAPLINEHITLPGGLIANMLLGRLVILCLIIGVTVFTNMIRSFRYCRGDKGEIKSWGISWGIKKGITCGMIAIIASLIINMIPPLRIPFLIIGFIPGLGSMVDGFILSVFYLLSYVSVAYPIWGVC